MTPVRAVTLSILFALSLLTKAAHADSNSPTTSALYFVAIGNQHYPKPVSGAAPEWSTPLAPVNSATRVAEALQRQGAVYGILLLSDTAHAVTREDMKKAIVDLKHRIRADHAARPVVFFYFIGHGIGDVYGQTLYLVPGDVGLHRMPSQSITSYLATSMLSNLDIIAAWEIFRLPPVMAYLDSLIPSDLYLDPQKPGDLLRVLERARQLNETDERNRVANRYPTGRVPPVPFVALFDNCYDAVEQDLVATDRSGSSTHGVPSSGLLDAFGNLLQKQILSDLAEAQSDGLVLYAARPGRPAADYENPEGSDPAPVGSLARRLLYAFHAMNKPTMSLQEIQAAMNSAYVPTYGAKTAAFSEDSPVPYRLSSPDAKLLDSTILKRDKPVGYSSPFETRYGTAPRQAE